MKCVLFCLYTIVSQNNASIFNSSIFSGGLVKLINAFRRSKLKFPVVLKSEGKNKSIGHGILLLWCLLSTI